MYKLFYFLRAIHTTLLFIVLEIIAISLFFGSNPYQNAVALSATNQVMGVLYEKTSAVTSYFSLSPQNAMLAQENAELREQLTQYQKSDPEPAPSHLTDKYIAARVIRNTTSKRDNYITINRGWKDGVKVDMALVNGNGIVGYVLDCSKHFSVVLSILNLRDFRTSGKIKGSGYIGTISWDGVNRKIVQFTEIDKYADISVGDTILTTQYSNIFPPDYPIGIIRDSQLSDGIHHNANVELFVNMAKLDAVYLIENPLQKEREVLERKIETKVK